MLECPGAQPTLCKPLKILIVSPYWPWPLNSGGSVAQFGWIDYLRHRHALTLLAPAPSAAEDAAVEKLRQLWPEVKIIPVRPPSASRPTLLGSFKAVLRNLPVVNHLYHALARKVNQPGSPTGSGRLARLSERLVTTVAAEARQGYDLVQVEYTEMLSLIHALPTDVPNLFSQIEIHYMVRERARSAASSASAYENYLYASDRALELDTLRRYDAIATMSEHDQRLLQAELPECDIRASPFAYVHPPGEHAEFRITPFANRLVYIGGSSHTPNVDAVEWFAATAWPTLRAQFPGLVLEVVGDWEPTLRQRLEAVLGVVFRGFVDDAAAVLQGAVMVVPLRVGSGIRTKILMAMTLGVPVVTTSVGVEGIDAEDGREVLRADDPADFATAVARLIRNPPESERLARNASAFVQRAFSPEASGARRDAIYQELQAKHASKHQREANHAG